jgi:hypothetical protein
MLVENEQGNYLFLPSSGRYSAGVVAAPGHEIVRAVLQRPRPLAEGFALIQGHLLEQKRPRAALCALELRSPEPFTFAGFAAFNQGYRSLLQDWGIPVESQNPIARTNVAPAAEGVSEPAVYAFAYSVPLARPSPWRSFLISGGGEVPETNLTAEGIIRPGETSEEALSEKAAFVMQEMQRRLDAVDADWSQVTVVDVYTVHTIHSAMRASLLKSLGAAGQHGFTWYHARPPIAGLEFEMDLRGVRVELCV